MDSDLSEAKKTYISSLFFTDEHKKHIVLPMLFLKLKTN